MTPLYSDGSKIAYWFAQSCGGHLARLFVPVVLVVAGATLEVLFRNDFFMRFGSILVAYSLIILWVHLSLFSDREGIQSWFDANLAKGIRPTGAFDSYEKTGSFDGYQNEIGEAYKQFERTAHGSKEWKLKAFFSSLQYMNEFSSRLPKQRHVEQTLISVNIFWAVLGTFIWGFGDLVVEEIINALL